MIRCLAAALLIAAAPAAAQVEPASDYGHYGLLRGRDLTAAPHEAVTVEKKEYCP